MSSTVIKAAPSPSPMPETTGDLCLAMERVLHSQVFRKAQRSQKFLRYMVQAASASPPITVKEYTIAIDVFDRAVSYDPAVDATVRVEASRLRARLREYYAEEGRDDPWILDVPKGGYTAVLRPRAPAEQRPPAPLSPEDTSAELNSWSALPSVQAGSGLPPVPPRWPGGAAKVVTSAAVLLLVIVAVLFLSPHPHPRPRAEAGDVPTAPTSLAILPLRNQTGDPGLDVPANSLTDDLIRQLSQIPALRLLSRTQAFHYRQPNADPQTLGKALGVQTVLLSELRRTPEHLLVAAELSSTIDGTVLLDREYIVDGNDLRSVQAGLQQDVVAGLHVESSARDPGRTMRSVAVNQGAYREFLTADRLARSGSPEDLHRAIDHLQAAVALDANFDLAWAALASEHLLLGLYFEAPRDHMPLARRFAQRALAINPSLGEAHGSLGLVHLVYDWDLPAAEAEMSTAGAEQASVGALACTVHLMERTGRPRRAEEMLDRMLTYDPQSVTLMAELGCVDYYRGNYPAALGHYRAALAADPHSPLPYWGLGKTLNAQGRHREAVAALAEFRKLNGFESPILMAETGYALGAAGDRTGASVEIRALAAQGQQSHGFVDPYLTALIYASMNDRDATFAWLEKARAVRSTFLISVLSDPKWQEFRDDPRFSALLGRMLQTQPS